MCVKPLQGGTLFFKLSGAQTKKMDGSSYIKNYV